MRERRLRLLKASTVFISGAIERIAAELVGGQKHRGLLFLSAQSVF
ncbi:hypothetical protein EC835_1157 [Providencia alcalifaciens]|uniref:Uncharacterized protein n=1 Tax=Providencia alcalifaciens TaxID=126385 RepID=A0A4R3NFP5_9GAMM|nr:hypothetical protein EC835_1157 [Providencia alcalifaciens]